MSAPHPLEIRTSVRELVGFVWRTGDLAGEGGGLRSSNQRAVEGTRGHRRLQQSRGEGYEPEVPVEALFERGEVRLRLAGRVDGLWREGEVPVVEEIKTVDLRWKGESDPLHIAQLRLYGALLAAQYGWAEVALHLTYLNYLTDEETTRVTREGAMELAQFLETTLERWFVWLHDHAAWMRARNASLAGLRFPFGKFRGGQRALARQVYQAVRDGENRFLEAPTGLGKTMATLFPALKGLPQLQGGQIFYVTAKRSGRIAAREAAGRLREAGAKLRLLMLSAKEQICFGEQSCDPRACPFAIGYYDRYQPAVRELLTHEVLERAGVEEVARRHHVCPFELQLDASLWTDLVVGDFNHVFDPSARLQRHFSEGPVRHVVLVDEAHNLIDRSREMHSATLRVEELEIGPSTLQGRGAGAARKAMRETKEIFEQWLASLESQEAFLPPRPHHDGALSLETAPRGLITRLKQTLYTMESFLAELPAGVDLSGWREPWLVIGAFLRVAESYDATCRTLADPLRGEVTLFCLDPSERLREVLDGLRAAVFFSATLSPLEYFRTLLGGREGEGAAQFPSPFRPEQMGLQILPLNVTYRERNDSLPAVAEAVAAHVNAAPGHHLVFGPSLAYLGELEAEVRPRLSGRKLLLQQSAMNEEERSAFLAAFEEEGEATLGLAVIGGIFSEGIDLPGRRLIGVTVIGVGLPRLSLARDLLQHYFDTQHGAGFDFAYRFPGMQRVLQAVGRLIRTEEDRGSALLIDHRYHEWRYRSLFPAWWRVERSHQSFPEEVSRDSLA